VQGKSKQKVKIFITMGDNGDNPPPGTSHGSRPSSRVFYSNDSATQFLSEFREIDLARERAAIEREALEDRRAADQERRAAEREEREERRAAEREEREKRRAKERERKAEAEMQRFHNAIEAMVKSIPSLILKVTTTPPQSSVSPPPGHSNLTPRHNQ
jgi:hypothetical protein